MPTFNHSQPSMASSNLTGHGYANSDNDGLNQATLPIPAPIHDENRGGYDTTGVPKPKPPPKPKHHEHGGIVGDMGKRGGYDTTGVPKPKPPPKPRHHEHEGTEDMGKRGGYDTTGVPKPKPPPKPRQL